MRNCIIVIICGNESKPYSTMMLWHFLRFPKGAFTLCYVVANRDVTASAMRSSSISSSIRDDSSLFIEVCCTYNPLRSTNRPVSENATTRYIISLLCTVGEKKILRGQFEIVSTFGFFYCKTNHPNCVDKMSCYYLNSNEMCFESQC